MVISASRRSDIPAFFGEWFIRRIREGFVHARNPRNPRSVARHSLDPGEVDCIVFWTRNAKPFLPRIDELSGRGHVFYFLYSLNAYGADIEPGLPGVELGIDGFLELADRVGPGRAIWRYDPILLGRNIDIAWHIDRFAAIASRLRGSAGACVISFLDMYRHLKKPSEAGLFREPLEAEIDQLARALGEIGAECGIRIQTCCESAALEPYGISRGACVDGDRIAELRLAAGLPAASFPKDRNQRPLCACARSVDIGTYDTCSYGCAYCYASRSPAKLDENLRAYDPDSPVLCGEPPDRIIPARDTPGPGLPPVQQLFSPRNPA